MTDSSLIKTRYSIDELMKYKDSASNPTEELITKGFYGLPLTQLFTQNIHTHQYPNLVSLENDTYSRSRRIFRKKDKTNQRKENDSPTRRSRAFKNGAFDKLHRHRQPPPSQLLTPINDYGNISRVRRSKTRKSNTSPDKESKTHRFTTDSVARARIFHPSYNIVQPVPFQPPPHMSMINCVPRYLEVGPFPGTIPGSLIPAPPLIDMGLVRTEGIDCKYLYSDPGSTGSSNPISMPFEHAGFSYLYPGSSQNGPQSWYTPIHEARLPSAQDLRLPSLSDHRDVENDRRGSEEENESETGTSSSCSSNTFVIRVS